MPADDFLVWVNGDLRPVGEAAISVVDHGLVVGGGGFETLAVVDGVPFAMSRHMRRIELTLKALSIDVPSDDELKGAMMSVVEANDLRDGKLRLTVTGGIGGLGSGAPTGPATVIAAVDQLGPTPPPHAVTVPWTRNETGATAGLKTTSYAENVRALRYAHEQGVGEALFGNTKGELCEGTGTNIFVVIDDAIVTPPLSSGCLAGVTRELVTEVAQVTEASLPMEILETASEIFLSSTTRDVQGLTRVDKRELAAPGPVTAEVSALFAALKATTPDP